MGMDGTGLSVADALALQDRVCRGGDGIGFGDGGVMCVFFLFGLLAWGGNGMFGGNGMNGAAGASLTRAELCDGFNFQSLENGMRGVQNGLCDGFYAVNSSLMNGFHGVDNALCQGFNSVNGNITQARFDAQQCLVA